MAMLVSRRVPLFLVQHPFGAQGDPSSSRMAPGSPRRDSSVAPTWRAHQRCFASAVPSRTRDLWEKRWDAQRALFSGKMSSKTLESVLYKYVYVYIYIYIFICIIYIYIF